MMKREGPTRWLSGVALFLALSTAAQASLIEVSYGGIVGVVDGELAGTFTVGDLVAGVFVYDTTTSSPGSGESTNYSGVIQSFEMRIGSYTASSNTGGVSVYNNAGGGFGDAAIFASYAGFTGAPVNGRAIARLQFSLNTTSALSTLGDLNLPSGSDLSALFAVNQAGTGINFMQFVSSEEVRYRLTDVSTRVLSAAGVPEPTTAALLALGLLGAGLAGKRRTH